MRLLAGVLALGGAPPLAAQATATIDLGVARVHYDAFLPSFATSLAAGVQLLDRTTSLTARGSLLRFESGRSTVQGAVAVSRLVPARGAWRGEIGGAAGASRYSTFDGFGHAHARVRLHRVGDGAGQWLAVSGGSTTYSSSTHPVASYGAGAWATRGALSVELSGMRTQMSDTFYTDLLGYMRLVRGRLTFDGTVGARAWSRGAGRGVWGEGSATLTLTRRLALTLAGGRYPDDPTRGSISGRYVTVALRVAPTRTATALSAWQSRPRNSRETASAFAIGPALSERRLVRARADDAATVELRGDFTNWDPVPLSRHGEETWEATLRVLPGLRRVQLRVDGGEWRPPAGAIVVADEFGGRVGLVVVQ